MLMTDDVTPKIHALELQVQALTQKCAQVDETRDDVKIIARDVQDIARLNAGRSAADDARVEHIEMVRKDVADLKTRLDRAQWYIIGLLITMLGSTIGWVVSHISN